MGAEQFTLLFTSDLHGRVGPEDPITGEPARGGAARVATLISEARLRVPDAIHIDLGDLVQGTPMSTLAARERPGEPHPMVRILNRAGCRAMVVGNHDFNFGLSFVKALRQTADFPMLAANVIGPDGKPYFDSVLRVKKGDRKIAILGLTTPQVPRWEEPWNIEGLTFRDAVETAREWVPRLREQGADAVIIAAHMGWEGVTDGGLEDPLPPENDVSRLSREVPDVDAIIMAHTHRFDERRGEAGALVVQAGWGGMGLGELTLDWDDGALRPEVSYHVWRAPLRIAPDVISVEIVREANERARQRFAAPVGVAAADFRVEDVRYRDNAILTLFHRVQLSAVGTDLSSSAQFRAEEGLAAGEITGLDLFRIYPYENDLTILELTVDGVRAYLEEIALAYTGPAVNGTPPPIHPRVRLYNHDTLAGCEYTLDPAQPQGHRVTRLTFRGDELPGERKLSLAVTSYRAQGGGGYQALRRARVVERTGRDIRTGIADYIRARGRISPEVFGNWRVAGVEEPAEV